MQNRKRMVRVQLQILKKFVTFFTICNQVLKSQESGVSSLEAHSFRHEKYRKSIACMCKKDKNQTYWFGFGFTSQPVNQPKPTHVHL